MVDHPHPGSLITRSNKLVLILILHFGDMASDKVRLSVSRHVRDRFYQMSEWKKCSISYPFASGTKNFAGKDNFKSLLIKLILIVPSDRKAFLLNSSI